MSKSSPKRRLANRSSRLEDFHGAGAFRDISFEVRRGEIVGMAGMVGAGRTEVARCIVGADRLDAGSISHTREGDDDCLARRRSEGGNRIPYRGSKTSRPRAENVARKECHIAGHPYPLRLHRPPRQNDMATSSLARASAHMPITRLAGQLSGGNQQKVVLAKWLLTKSDIFIFDEPTRGIDVGAKAEIYALMRELTEHGAGILMISSEMPELLRMSDRILVMHEGDMAGELTRAEANEERVVSMQAEERRGKAKYCAGCRSRGSGDGGSPWNLAPIAEPSGRNLVSLSH